MNRDFTYFGVGFASGVSCGILSVIVVGSYMGFRGYKNAMRFLESTRPVATVTSIVPVVNDETVDAEVEAKIEE